MPSPDKQAAASPEALQRVLKGRARALAREEKIEPESGSQIEVLEFVLANEHYGLETAYVREVNSLKALLPLPCTPPFILGITNLRGQILAVNDLKRFFNLPDKGLSDLNKIIILHWGQMEMGLLADAVVGVRAVALSEVQAPPPTLEGLSPDYLRGVTPVGLIVLDAEKILADPKLIVHEEVEPTSK